MQTVKRIVKRNLHSFYDDYLEGLRAEEKQGLEVIQTILDTEGQQNISHLFPEHKKDIKKNFEDLKQE